MQRVLSHLGLLLLAAGLSLQAHAGTVPSGYRFQTVVLSGRKFDPLGFDAPVLNNRGAVAYHATRRQGGGAIYRSRRGNQTQVASRPKFTRFGNLTLNLTGQVGFEASLRRPDGEGIFRGKGGPVKRIAGTQEAGDFDFVNAGPSLNDDGLVAFIGERIVNEGFVDGVWAGRGDAVTALADTSGPIDDFTGNPSLNNAGQAAFLAVLDTEVTGLFLTAGGQIVTVADDTGLFTSAFNMGDPSLNDQGDVAFRAGTNEDPADNSGSTAGGIFLYRNGVVTPVFQAPFEQISGIGDPSLNNAGEVAFLVSPSFDATILVTGPDLTADRVIGTGDSLAGRTVERVLFSREGLNDTGQLAFTAFFTDGSAGVFLATPTS